MTIDKQEITVGKIVEGYVNNDEQGVRGFGGLLDIRPPYQREFIYNDKEQKAVINTVLHGYPLNVMYWVKRSEDAECPYEIMDGQQRTLSLCEYVAGKFSFDFKFFANQPNDVQQKILDYPLDIYICEGTPSEKLDWFQTINLAGKPLNDQEINNAIYAGPFVSDAKKHFSKTNSGGAQSCSWMDGRSRNETRAQANTSRLYGRPPARPQRKQPLDLLPERPQLGNNKLRYEEVQKDNEGLGLGYAL